MTEQRRDDGRLHQQHCPCALDGLVAAASTIRAQLYAADQLSQDPAASALLAALIAAEGVAATLQTAARACDLTGAVTAVAAIKPQLLAAEQMAEQLQMSTARGAIVAAEGAAVDAEARAERKYYALARSIACARADLAQLAALADLPAPALAAVVVAQQAAATLQTQLDGETQTFVATIQQLIVDLFAIDQLLLPATAQSAIVYDAAVMLLDIEAMAAKMRACAICSPAQTASMQIARVRRELVLADKLADRTTDVALRAEIQTTEAMATAIRAQIEAAAAVAALRLPVDALRVQLVACKLAADALSDIEVSAHLLHAIGDADALVAFLLCDVSFSQTLVVGIEQQLAQAEAALVMPHDAALKQQILALEHQLDAMSSNVVVCCASIGVGLMGEKQLAAFRADLDAAQHAASQLGDNAIVALLLQAQALALQLRAHEQQAEAHIEDYFYALRAALEAAELLIVDPTQAPLLSATLALEMETAAIHSQTFARMIQAALAAIARLLLDVAAAAQMAAQAQNFEAQAQLVNAEVAATQLQAQVRSISAPSGTPTAL
jgi:hypothetical protein